MQRVLTALHLFSSLPCGHGVVTARTECPRRLAYARGGLPPCASVIQASLMATRLRHRFGLAADAEVLCRKRKSSADRIWKKRIRAMLCAPPVSDMEESD